jgi:cobalt-zinc-cadmium efflux system outer membrane protein
MHRSRRLGSAAVWLVPLFAHAGTPSLLLGSLTLNHALELMRDRDPTLLMQRAAASQAQADVSIAGERPNATLVYSTAQIDPAGHNGPGSLWDKRFDTIVNLSQPFERGGKRTHRLAQANANADAAHADFADTVRTERLAVRQAYWELKRAEEKYTNELTLQTIEHRALDAAEQRLKVGDASRLDVERLRVSTAETDNSVDDAQQSLRDAQVALAVLLDVAPQSETITTADAWPRAVDAPNADIDATLAARPDVKAATQRVQAADAALDLAHAQRHRDVTVSGQYEHNPDPYGHTLLGVGVSIPIFTGNDFHGEIERANADIDAAQASLAHVQALARADLQRAMSDLRTSTQRVRRFDSDIVQRAVDTEKAVETAYTRGGIGLADVLDARRELKSLQDDAADARADYAEALAAFYAATQADENPPPP